MKCVWFFLTFLLGLACFGCLLFGDVVLNDMETWVSLVVLLLGMIQVFISVVGFFFSLFIYREKRRKKKRKE